MSVREVVLGASLISAAGCVTAGCALLCGLAVALIVGGVLGAALALVTLAEVG
ncbi:MAG TPA: hypothetical protein VG497_24565 [Kribbella sp.]|nr:hypothetical protein [Kribbella sp.]